MPDLTIIQRDTSRDIRLSPSYYDLARGPIDRELVTRPGPGMDCWGRIRRPLLSLGEEIQRALHGDPPRPLSARMTDRVLATVADAETAHAVVALLLPSLRFVVKEIVVDLLQEEAA